jgi:hypothetical protein
MGRNYFKISIIVLSLLFIASTTSAAELIQNGGFESGELSPWEKIGENNTWAVTDEYSLEGTYSGFVQRTDQVAQSFNPRLGSELEVFTIALMTAMRGTYTTIEIHYTDESNPTLVSLFIPLAFQWYAFDLLNRVDQDRYACKIVLTGHRGGDSPEHTRTWFDAISVQNNAPDDPPEVEVDETFQAETKRIRVRFNLKRPRTHLSLALRAEELPDGIHEGPVAIRVLLSQEGFTTEFEAEAELEGVPHKRDHIIRLMDPASAEKVKAKE